MIPNEANSQFISDVPFTCINFNGFEVPYYSEEAVYQDVFFKQDILNTPYWFGNKSMYIFLKIKTSFYLNNLFLRISSTNGVNMYRDVDLTTIKVVGAWTYVYAIIPQIISDHNGTHYNVSIESHSDNDSRMIAPLRKILQSSFDKYLVLNFWNYSGDVLDFSFDTFNTLEPNNLGLNYVVEGGVDTGATKQVVYNETFRDQRYTAHTLTAHTGKTAVLTIGGNKGVPEYVAEYINNILCCDTIYLNGKRIVRSGDNVPEVKQIVKGYPFVTVSVEIEYVATEIDDFSIIN